MLYEYSILYVYLPFTTLFWLPIFIFNLLSSDVVLNLDIFFGTLFSKLSTLIFILLKFISARILFILPSESLYLFQYGIS